MMDALATENQQKQRRKRKPGKTLDDSHEEDLDDRISVDIDSASELLEREIDENTNHLKLVQKMDRFS